MGNAVFTPYREPKDGGKNKFCLFCKNQATTKVVYGKISMYCCDKKKCQDRTKEFAITGNKEIEELL